MADDETDIAIIGAGPAGSTAAALLRDRGWRVTVVERSHFPRFTIGESLLPQCMESLHAAAMLGPLEAAGFQIKRGVTFAEGPRSGQFSFADQHTPGWHWTWHVPRAEFDDILAREAAARGADVRFGQTIEAIDFTTPNAPQLTVASDSGQRYRLNSCFVCDASGSARVLPRFLGLDEAGDAPPRAAVFTHVADHIDDPHYRRDEIMVTIHPDHPRLWYWLIPFADDRASIGVVGDPAIVYGRDAESPDTVLRRRLAEEPHQSRLLANAAFDRPVNAAHIRAHNSTTLYGRDYALLGNAGGFIDPIFSSGVTVALQSAVLAVDPIDRQLRGLTADWADAFEIPLRNGLRVFRCFVDAWYRGELKHVFFKSDPDPGIRRMLGSILAGYVWDTSNPYVAAPERRLAALCRLCAP